MADDLEVAIHCARSVALLHPTSIRRAPIGKYYFYEDPRIRLRVSDQAGLDDFGVWAPARGGYGTTVLLWSPYMAAPGQPQVFIPGDWIPYLGALATCRSRPFLDWRAAHWIPGASREAAREMAGSPQNARQYLGKEGAFLHA